MRANNADLALAPARSDTENFAVDLGGEMSCQWRESQPFIFLARLATLRRGETHETYRESRL